MDVASVARRAGGPQRLGVVLAAAWLAVSAGLDLVTPPTLVLVPFFSFAALIACAVASPRVTAGVGAGVMVAAVLASWWDDSWASEPGQQAIRVLNSALVGAAAVLVAVVRVRRERAHARVVAIAEVAQRAVLPTVPEVVGSVHTRTRYLSAADDALVGGDLYDWCQQGSSTRFLIGDVRGKGLGAVEQAARAIRCFRQFAASTAALPDVARAMSLYLVPYLGVEEFVTALLVDASDPDHVEVVSCGHPPPLLVHADGSPWLPDLPPGLPLGLGERYESVRVPWTTRDKLLLYTDGLSEARDAGGVFLAAESLAASIAALAPDDALEQVVGAVRRHVGGDSFHDDMALVLLENAAAAPTALTTPDAGSAVASPAPARGGDPLLARFARPGRHPRPGAVVRRAREAQRRRG